MRRSARPAFRRGAAGEFAGDIHLQVEEAALHGRFWPGVRERGADPRATVGDDDLRFGDLFEQGLPGGGGLPRAPLPGDHVSGVTQRDQQTPRPDPDPIDEDRIVDFAGDRHPRSQGPAPGCLVTERSSGAAVDLGLRVLAGQPGQEAAQLLPAGHIGSSPDGRCPAGPAPPPLRSCRGLPVPHERIAAYQTRRRVRGKVHE